MKILSSFFTGITTLWGYIGGLLIHVWAIWIAYEHWGPFWAFLTFLSPFASEIVIIILLAFHPVGIINDFSVACFIYVAAGAALAFGAAWLQVKVEERESIKDIRARQGIIVD